jgi:hypothetical protein
MPDDPPRFSRDKHFPRTFCKFLRLPRQTRGCAPRPTANIFAFLDDELFVGGAAPRSIGAKLCRDRSPSAIICISAFSSCLTYIRFGAGKNSFFLNLASRFFSRPLSPATHSFALAFGINVVLGRK